MRLDRRLMRSRKRATLSLGAMPSTLNRATLPGAPRKFPKPEIARGAAALALSSAARDKPDACGFEPDVGNPPPCAFIVVASLLLDDRTSHTYRELTVIDLRRRDDGRVHTSSSP